MANVQVNGTQQLQLQQAGTGILAGISTQKLETFKSVMQTAGVLADQCDTLHMKTYSFVASTPQTIDLSTLTDIYGNAISFSGGRVRVLAIKINSTTDGVNLILGDSVTNEWDAFLSAAGTLTVFPGTANNDGFFILAAPNTTGMAVSSSHKTLKLDPGSNTFTADVIIAGCSS
jgi:hypothetical protein